MGGQLSDALQRNPADRPQVATRANHEPREPRKPRTKNEDRSKLQIMLPCDDIGMGHLPLSHKTFSAKHPTFIQQSQVVPEELEGYEIWREAEGGYF